jgi:hypothetical protein
MATDEYFVKVYASILDSSVWDHDAETRIVWITLLAMADASGKIHASVPGIANRARVSLEKTEQALDIFQQPDPYSRNQAFDGRRLERIDRDWLILNYPEHRSRHLMRKEAERARKRRWWRENKSVVTKETERNKLDAKLDAPSAQLDALDAPSAQLDAEVEVEVERERDKNLSLYDLDLDKDKLKIDIDNDVDQLDIDESKKKFVQRLYEIWSIPLSQALATTHTISHYMKDLDPLEVLEQAAENWRPGRELNQLHSYLVSYFRNRSNDRRKETTGKEAKPRTPDLASKLADLALSFENNEEIETEQIRRLVNEAIEDSIPLPVMLDSWIDEAKRIGSITKTRTGKIESFWVERKDGWFQVRNKIKPIDFIG